MSQRKRQVTISIDSAEENIISELSEGDPSESCGPMNLRYITANTNNKNKEATRKSQTSITESQVRKSSANGIISKPTTEEQIRKTSSPEVLRKDLETDSPNNLIELTIEPRNEKDNYSLLNESTWVSYDDISKELFTDNEFSTELNQKGEIKWLRVKDMNPVNYRVSVFIDTISHENVKYELY